MLFTGKETPKAKPVLRSWLDKALNRYPKQHIFWDSAVKKYPDWDNDELSWTEMTEPLSDNTEVLLKMISETVVPEDTVLTTVIHAPFFATQTRKVHTFDISPLQLHRCLNEFPHPQSSWFCDVFHPSMLRTVLANTNPTVVYLSNILDYGVSEEHNQLLRELHKSPTIRMIMCSTKCAWGNTSIEISDYLTHLSAGNGWRSEIYKVVNDTDAFFRMIRR